MQRCTLGATSRELCLCACTGAESTSILVHMCSINHLARLSQFLGCRKNAESNLEGDREITEGARAHRARLQELSGAVQRHRTCTEQAPALQHDLDSARAAQTDLQTQVRAVAASDEFVHVSSWHCCDTLGRGRN